MARKKKINNALYSVPVFSRGDVADVEFDYSPYLLRMKIENVDNMSHLREVSYLDPIGMFITHDVTKSALDDWFFFVDEHGKELNTPQTARIFNKLINLNFHEYFMDAVDKARIFGWSILAITNSDLMTYSPEECSVSQTDERGFPIEYEITTPDGHTFTLKDSEVIHLVSEVSQNVVREGKGISVLAPVWDDVIEFRWLVYSMTEFGARIGGGFYVVKTKARNSQELIAIQQMMRGMNSKRVAVVGANVEDINVVTSSGLTINYKPYADVLLERISAGSGIPKDIITGVSAGRITGSEVNERGFFRKLEVVQRHFEKYIYRFLEKFSLPRYQIKWRAEFRLDERAEAELLKTKIETAKIMRELELFSDEEIRGAVGYGS